jgi:hypothetical protein
LEAAGISAGGPSASVLLGTDLVLDGPHIAKSATSGAAEFGLCTLRRWLATLPEPKELGNWTYNPTSVECNGSRQEHPEWISRDILRRVSTAFSLVTFQRHERTESDRVGRCGRRIRGDLFASFLDCCDFVLRIVLWGQPTRKSVFEKIVVLDSNTASFYVGRRLICIVCIRSHTSLNRARDFRATIRHPQGESFARGVDNKRMH